MFFKNFRGKLFENGKDTQNLRQRYRKPSRKGFQIISYMLNLNVKQALANQICCTRNMYNYPKRQKMPKRVKMFTSKWHRKQRHFFIHPFRSLECILRGEGGIFNNSPFWDPLHFDWTKLAHAQLGYGAYNKRP